MSHVRPQVVQVGMAGGPAIALVVDGSAYGFEVASLADIADAVREEGQDFIDRLLPLRGTWRIP
jgi:hypothetical protein